GSRPKSRNCRSYWATPESQPQRCVRRARTVALVDKSNVARWYKANNPVPLVARQIYLCSFVLIPDDSLTNRIFGFDYDLWRYWIPLPFDGNPILTLPDIVASAVTISVRATQEPFGGPHMLKPLTYIRRNVLELAPVHCSSGRANCTEHQRSDEWLSFAVSKHRTQLAN